MDSTSGMVRQMPASIEAEQALLGSIIVNPDSFDSVGGMIVADDFYVEEHRHIYNALLKMYSQSCSNFSLAHTTTLAATSVRVMHGWRASTAKIS